MLGCMKPMSSPMMNRMLGFCSCCAAAGPLAAIATTSDASRPNQEFLAMLLPLHFFELPPAPAEWSAPKPREIFTAVPARPSPIDERAPVPTNGLDPAY